VVGAPSEKWGEEVVAFVVTTSEPDFSNLEEHARQTLAGFKVPKRYENVDALPRNPAGKVLKRELRERLSQ
jgi:fatty-acyl-CoA synthase